MPNSFSHFNLPGSGKERLYLKFYDLKEAPFSITPDPDFLYFSSTHQNVLDKTLYGISNRAGFILLTGEVGTGKTTLCRSIIDSLDSQAETVYIINPSFSGEELLASILDDLGVACAADDSKKSLIDQLNRFALSASQTRPVVIIIDDAQTMPVSALEDLRLLSNLETDKEKLLQMVLVGQPELVGLLARPEMRQLQQRIAINCHLDFLSPQEIDGYIERRLFVAGNKGQLSFHRKAKTLIAGTSGGIPRLINKICDYALTAGYIANTFAIGPAHVQRALAELGPLDLKTARPKHAAVDRLAPDTRAWIQYATWAVLLLITLGLSIYIWADAGNTREKTVAGTPVATSEKSRQSTAPASVQKAASPIVNSSQAPPDTPLPAAANQETAAPLMPETKTEVAAREPVKPEKETPPIATTAVPGTLAQTTGPPAMTPVTVEKIEAPRPYILQFGSYRNLSRLRAAYAAYRAQGIKTQWARVDLGNKGVWYRLFIGRFKTRADALQYREKQELFDSMVIHAPYTVIINASASRQQLDRLRADLQDHAIDHYTTENDDGSYRILSGAFVTREGAEVLATEVQGLGYPAGVVTQ